MRRPFGISSRPCRVWLTLAAGLLLLTRGESRAMTVFLGGDVGSRMVIEWKQRENGKSERHEMVVTLRTRNGDWLTEGRSLDGAEEIPTEYGLPGLLDSSYCGTESGVTHRETLRQETLRVGSRRIRCDVVRQRTTFYEPEQDSIVKRFQDVEYWVSAESAPAEKALRTVSYSEEIWYRDGRVQPRRAWMEQRTLDLDAWLRVGARRIRCRVDRMTTDGAESIGWIPYDVPVTTLRYIDIQRRSGVVTSRSEERVRDLHLVDAPGAR